jgi:hypothetical protein
VSTALVNSTQAGTNPLSEILATRRLCDYASLIADQSLTQNLSKAIARGSRARIASEERFASAAGSVIAPFTNSNNNKPDIPRSLIFLYFV